MITGRRATAPEAAGTASGGHPGERGGRAAGCLTALSGLACLLALGCGSRGAPVPVPVTLYAASYSGGVYRSSNGGVNWVEDGQPRASLEGYVKRLAWGPEGELLVATSGAGLFRREADGFRALKMPGTGRVTAVATHDASSSLWAGTRDEGVFLSVDGGVSWTDFNEGLDFHRVSALAVTQGSTPVLYCATDGGLFRRSLKEPWTWTTRDLGAWDARAVALGPGPQGPILLGGAGVGGPPPVMVSRDGGTTWEKSGRGLPPGNVFQLTGRPVANEFHAFAATSQGVYRLREEGQAWEEMGPGGPHSTVLTVALAGNHLFAGGEEGLYRIPLGGGRWEKVSRGLPRGTITSLLASP